MGDRISISFKNGSEESVAFFSHWDGMHPYKSAQAYVKLLKKMSADTGGTRYPLDRLEPQTVMVDFIKWYLQNEIGNEHVTSNYYLGVNGDDGDNSDNGHYTIDLAEKDVLPNW